MKTFRSRTLASALLIPALLVMPGCSDDDSGTTLPETPPVAIITVTVTAVAPITPATTPGFAFQVTVPTRIESQNALGANINFAQLRLISLGEVVEVSEIGADRYTEITGSNRVEGNSTRDDLVSFDFNATNVNRGTLHYNFTDDRGNVLEAEFAVDFGL